MIVIKKCIYITNPDHDCPTLKFYGKARLKLATSLYLVKVPKWDVYVTPSQSAEIIAKYSYFFQ